MAREKPKHTVAQSPRIPRFEIRSKVSVPQFFFFMVTVPQRIIAEHTCTLNCYRNYLFFSFLLMYSPWSLIPRLDIIFVRLILAGSLKKFKQLSGFPELHPSVQFLLTCLLAVLGYSKTST